MHANQCEEATRGSFTITCSSRATQSRCGFCSLWDRALLQQPRRQQHEPKTMLHVHMMNTDVVSGRGASKFAKSATMEGERRHLHHTSAARPLYASETLRCAVQNVRAGQAPASATGRQWHGLHLHGSPAHATVHLPWEVHPAHSRASPHDQRLSDTRWTRQYYSVMTRHRWRVMMRTW